ncbi:MAG: hypothetical protein LBU34_00770 [Planctomycetaceae bacterium]|nr:hypothetical protein [Planctomycetaceae bacterium]
MCITVDKAKRNQRIGISQPDTKTKGRRRFAEGFSPIIASALADREFYTMLVVSIV